MLIQEMLELVERMILVYNFEKYKIFHRSLCWITSWKSIYHSVL